MTGILTPVACTPLAERHRAAARSREAESSGHNSDDVGRTPLAFRAALRSLWCQGVAGNARSEYFRVLWKSVARDAADCRHAGQSAARIKCWLLSSADGDDPSAIDGTLPLAALIDRARDAAVRAEPNRPLAEVDAWAVTLKRKVDRQALSPADRLYLYRWGYDYFVRQRRVHRFPGAYLVTAFKLAIKQHDDIMINRVVRWSVAGARLSAPAPTGGTNSR